MEGSRTHISNAVTIVMALLAALGYSSEIDVLKGLIGLGPEIDAFKAALAENPGKVFGSIISGGLLTSYFRGLGKKREKGALIEARAADLALQDQKKTLVDVDYSEIGQELRNELEESS